MVRKKRLWYAWAMFCVGWGISSGHAMPPRRENQGTKLKVHNFVYVPSWRESCWATCCLGASEAQERFEKAGQDRVVQAADTFMTHLQGLRDHYVREDVFLKEDDALLETLNKKEALTAYVYRYYDDDFSKMQKACECFADRHPSFFTQDVLHLSMAQDLSSYQVDPSINIITFWEILFLQSNRKLWTQEVLRDFLNIYQKILKEGEELSRNPSILVRESYLNESFETKATNPWSQEALERLHQLGLVKQDVLGPKREPGVADRTFQQPTAYRNNVETTNRAYKSEEITIQFQERRKEKPIGSEDFSLNAEGDWQIDPIEWKPPYPSSSLDMNEIRESLNFLVIDEERSGTQREPKEPRSLLTPLLRKSSQERGDEEYEI